MENDGKKEDTIKTMSTIEKVQLMNSLVNIIKDKEFIQLVTGKENGELALKVFERAATQTIEMLMSDKQVEDREEEVDILNRACQDMNRTVDYFLNSELTQALILLANNLNKSNANTNTSRGVPKTTQNNHVQNNVSRNNNNRYYDRDDNKTETGIF